MKYGADAVANTSGILVITVNIKKTINQSFFTNLYTKQININANGIKKFQKIL